MVERQGPFVKLPGGSEAMERWVRPETIAGWKEAEGHSGWTITIFLPGSDPPIMLASLSREDWRAWLRAVGLIPEGTGEAK